MSHFPLRLVLIVLLFAGTMGTEIEALAQEPVSPKSTEAKAAAHESIDSITKAVYASISGPAGAERDWDFFRSLFAPGARLIPVRITEAGNSLTAFSVDEYVTMVDDYFVQNGFFEIEIYRKTEQYGSIAHHFSTYESRRNLDDPDPFTRGINSFQLMHDGSRWWIVTIFWQGESPDVPIPSSYLK